MKGFLTKLLLLDMTFVTYVFRQYFQNHIIKNVIFKREINDFTVRRFGFTNLERGHNNGRGFILRFFTLCAVCKQRKFHRLELRSRILKTQTSGAHKTLIL